MSISGCLTCAVACVLALSPAGACAGTAESAKREVFEGFSLPYEGAADVSVLDGGWLIVGLAPVDAPPATSPDDELMPPREWFFLVPRGSDVELLQRNGRTWLVRGEHVAAATAKLGRGVTHTPVKARVDTCARENVVVFSGTATLSQGADGSCSLRVLDGAGKERLTAVFRVQAPDSEQASSSAQAPTQTEEQSSSCDADCDGGSCSITCIGRMALCDCHDGSPRCRCGRKLTIVLGDPTSLP